ncbi:hypothetical protein Clacol_007386 [Clathrus columnatus]|uniref:AB hydrolase-1 domain-containing protein n=1 Tax=Clathrus columnatus TaxID=1419009 RepID=A0AAV5AJM0_9AGAM|nr:hypothetical protein Clacol_007386 [Clathrus columnatus]
MRTLDIILPLTWAALSLANSQEPLLPNLQPTCVAFDPYSYSQNVARCPAINRATSQPVELDLQYVDINPTAEKILLFVHGWPALWSTWSNQIKHFEASIPELLAKNYRLIIPNLRGFGASTHPGDIESSSTMADMVSDLACILGLASPKSKAVCIGHDWGAQICWEAARMRPDLIEAVAGAVVPYIAAAGPFMPIEQVALAVPKLAYQTYFEKNTEEATLELDSSIRRTLRATYRSSSSPPPSTFLSRTRPFLEAYKDIDVIPPIPFMSSVEEDYLVEQYLLQGFRNTLQFYTHGNRYGSWAFDHSQGNLSISQPALFIPPTNDPVADWESVATLLGSASFFSYLRVENVALNGLTWVPVGTPFQLNWLKLVFI